jgi:hypothetical protein
MAGRETDLRWPISNDGALSVVVSIRRGWITDHLSLALNGQQLFATKVGGFASAD